MVSKNREEGDGMCCTYVYFTESNVDTAVGKIGTEDNFLGVYELPHPAKFTPNVAVVPPLSISENCPAGSSPP
jgi:hypothetical protein